MTSRNIYQHHLCIYWQYPCEHTTTPIDYIYLHLGTSTNIILHLLAISMCSLQQPASMTSRYIYLHHTASASDIHVEPTTNSLVTSRYIYPHHAASNVNIQHLPMYCLQQTTLMTSRNIYQQYTASAGDIHM